MIPIVKCIGHGSILHVVFTFVLSQSKDKITLNFTVIRGRVTAGDVTFINYKRHYQYQQSTTTLPPQIYLTAREYQRQLIMYSVEIRRNIHDISKDS